MSSLSERIKELLDERGMKRSELARRVGISASAVTQWCNGDTARLDHSVAEKTASVLGVTVKWLTTGLGNKTAPREGVDFMVMRRYDVMASCGSGTFVEATKESEFVEEIRVSPDWFRRNISANRVNGFDLITAHGDSMEQTFHDSDILVIDTTQRHIDRDGIWCFTYESCLFAKRVQIIPQGLEIISDNPAYKPFTIRKEDLDRLFVSGRVIRSFSCNFFR